MEVGDHHVIIGDHGIEEFVGDIHGFHRGDAKPFKAIDTGQRVQKIGQPGDGFIGLTSTKCRVVAIGSDKNARKDDLTMPQVNQPMCFPDDIFKGFGSEGGANSGNDAEGAVGIATILNPYFSSHVFRCGSRQLHQRECQNSGSSRAFRQDLRRGSNPSIDLVAESFDQGMSIGVRVTDGRMIADQ